MRTDTNRVLAAWPISSSFCKVRLWNGYTALHCVLAVILPCCLQIVACLLRCKCRCNCPLTELGAAPALQIRSDWTSLIDEGAGRFFHELDYEREAINSTVFKQQMAGLDGIFVPDVYVQLSNKEVLVTSWVPGE